MAKFTKTYPTDLKYTEWQQIMEFFPSYTRGRPRKWEMWQILNAIYYVNRSGEQWRMLPVDFPPWQTVYGYYWRWKRNGLWPQINAILVRRVRQKAGRDPQPSAGILADGGAVTAQPKRENVGRRRSPRCGRSQANSRAKTAPGGGYVGAGAAGAGPQCECPRWPGRLPNLTKTVRMDQT